MKKTSDIDQPIAVVLGPNLGACRALADAGIPAVLVDTAAPARLQAKQSFRVCPSFDIGHTHPRFKSPDVAIRTDADTGLSDGRWVTVLSGIREGDEVVVDGVYQLLLATAGNAAKGGHFHADGTFHDGED